MSHYKEKTGDDLVWADTLAQFKADLRRFFRRIENRGATILSSQQDADTAQTRRVFRRMTTRELANLVVEEAIRFADSITE